MRARFGWRICLLLFLVCFLTGCLGKKDSQESETGIKLYYINSSGDGFEQVSYEPQNTDDLPAAVAEIIHQLADSEEYNMDKFETALQGVGKDSIEYDEGSIRIDFQEAYSQLSPVNESLIRTAIVKSVLQLEGVKSVSFSVNGASLLDQEGSPVGPMNESTFILEGDEKGIYSGSRTVTLYYADEKGTGLIPYKTTITSKDNEPFEKIVLEALLKVPSGKKKKTEKKMISPLMEDLQINQTQVLNNICYVDLSEEIENVVPGVEEEVTVYAMVNSLASLNPIYPIQFTVNGSKRKNLNSVEGFDGLFTSDLSLVKE